MQIKKTCRQRVLEILIMAMKDAQGPQIGSIYVMGEKIFCPDGWIPQWCFVNIHLCGSTKGKARIREMRRDPELLKKYAFEIKHEGTKWYYRIRKREPAQLKMQLAEAQ